MKIVSTFWLQASIGETLKSAGQYTDETIDRVFPQMIRSQNVIAFSRDYFYDHFSPFFEKWIAEKMKNLLRPNGSYYIPGSGMCEVGTHFAISQLHESVLPFLGYGEVDKETLADAAQRGYLDRIPKERVGDATPGAFNTNVIIPNGVRLNDVTDGGHSTLMALVSEEKTSDQPFDVDYNKLKKMKWEWQNRRWVEFEDAVQSGVIYKDIGV